MPGCLSMLACQGALGPTRVPLSPVPAPGVAAPSHDRLLPDMSLPDYLLKSACPNALLRAYVLLPPRPLLETAVRPCNRLPRGAPMLNCFLILECPGAPR